MRNQKTVSIKRADNDTREITIRELTVREVRQFWQEEAPKVVAEQGKITDLQPFMSKCVTGVTIDEMDDFTFSELKVIYEAFREVNAVFFEMAQAMDIENPMFAEFKGMIWRELMRKFVFLFREGTSTPGTTDGASSSPPSDTPTPSKSE